MPWEKWPKVGISLAVGTGFAVLGFCGEFLLEVSLDTDGRGGGPSNKLHRFFPIAQTSSQELPPMFIPWVLQSQAMSHARKVIPSTKDA